VPEVTWHPTATRVKTHAAIVGLQLSVRSLPGRAASGDLGDFYDVHPLVHGRWGLAVGDVRAGTLEDDWAAESPAVLHQAVLRSLTARPAAGSITTACAILRAMAFLEARPSRVLAGLNRAILAWPARDQYLTMTYAAVRPTRLGTLVRICTAGEQTAFVRRAGGDVLPVGGPGTALGLQQEPQLRDARVLLRSGDSLVLVTENVTQAVNPANGTSFGAAGLRMLLANLDDASAARSVRAILRAVRKFRGRSDHETVALVLKVPGNKREGEMYPLGLPGTPAYLPQMARRS